MKSESIIIAKSELQLTLDQEIKEALAQFTQLYESLEDYRKQILTNQKNEGSMNRMVVFEMIDENHQQYHKLAKKLKFLIKQLELEAVANPATHKATKKQSQIYRQKVQALEFDYSTKLKEVQQVKHTSSHWKQYERQKTKREILSNSAQKLDKQGDTIIEMQNIADQSQKLGGAIQSDLLSQRLTIENVLDRLHHIKGLSVKAQNYVRQMGRDKLVRRMLLLITAGVLGLVILCLIMHKLLVFKNLF